MRLHSLRIENFRSVTERTVDFPDTGVVVVAGENERGKTTMIEALDLLLNPKVKSSGSGREVRDVQPLGSELAPAVQAEITIGEHRVVYRKQYLRQNSTSLVFVAGPRAGTHITGGEAHDQATALFSGADPQLWGALRLLQATGLGSLALGDSSALQRALDRLAGGEQQADDSLVERVEQEFRRYFTRTGAATGDFARAIKEVSDATGTAAAARLALAEVDDVAGRLAEAEERAAHLAAALGEQVERDRDARKLLARVENAQKSRDAAATMRDLAETRAASARGAQEAREALIGTLAERTADADRAGETLTEAAASLEPQTGRMRAAEAALAEARTALGALRAEATNARSGLRTAESARELARLADLAASLDRTAGRLNGARAVVNSVDFDAADLARLDVADREVTSAEAALQAGSARLSVARLGKEPLTIDGTAVTEETEYAVTAPLMVEVPGSWRLALSPAAGTHDRRDDVDRAREARRRLLGELGIADATDGHSRLRAAEAARAEAAALEAERRALLEGREEAEVRAALDAALAEHEAADSGNGESRGADSARRPKLPDAAEIERLREVFEGVESRLRAAEESESEAATAVESLRADHQRARDEHTRAETTVASTRAAAADAATLLEGARKDSPDDTLDAGALDAARALDEARATLESADAGLSALAPESIRAEADTSGRELEGLSAALQEAKDTRTRVDGELTGLGQERRQAEADAADAAEEVARGNHGRLERRANAAALLRDTLLRHRDAARARYIEPFARTIADLGRPVFGPDFGVGIGDNLEIVDRTLDGVRVPFDMLSSGAREQLGIIVRLAAAILVDPGEGVPVMLDDALGYSDQRRRARVLSVLMKAAESTQVVVLTCTPERYAALREGPGATFVQV